jgi:hypothetical protein
MAAPVAGTLTGAGYSLANGVYTKTIGTFVVSVVISDEPSGGSLSIVPNGDVTPADILAVQASLAALGLNQITASFANVPLTAAGGLVAFGQTL